MTSDLVSIIKFESGELSEKEIVEFLSGILSDGLLDTFDESYEKLVNKYISLGVLDEEGNINYIKLNEIM